MVARALVDDGEEGDRRVGALEERQPDAPARVRFRGAAAEKIVDDAEKRFALHVVRDDRAQIVAGIGKPVVVEVAAFVDEPDRAREPLDVAEIGGGEAHRSTRSISCRAITRSRTPPPSADIAAGTRPLPSRSVPAMSASAPMTRSNAVHASATSASPQISTISGGPTGIVVRREDQSGRASAARPSRTSPRSFRCRSRCTRRGSEPARCRRPA